MAEPLVFSNTRPGARRRWASPGDRGGGLIVEQPDWWAGAGCTTEPVEVFFPGRGKNSRQARAVCAECPVSARCYQWALENPETTEAGGIWAGHDHDELERIRNQQPGMPDR